MEKPKNLYVRPIDMEIPWRVVNRGVGGGEGEKGQRVPKKLDPRRTTPRHIIITLPKIKRKDLHPRLLYPAKLSFRMEGKTENK